ncbi:MAG: hypothetical protein IPP02_13030 [Chitinophagaceae bacterium]|jgi:hypothetical protein|nr:hypothetical protein [Chitinophagaceae bacterium]MBK8301477.1 hypothetical protein [Chitinophagaceae bacterium]MBK9464624.1 hypothetical protein [Chitinophagaceae bacterium]MBK9660021.1 hypothetical protein [Chitinophagaceae bacterium]MBK9939277.1 hypothetical protein [Chitinophagaceae bacterium]
MKTLKNVACSIIILLLSIQKNDAQTYNGRIVILFTDTLEGKITVNLTGENKGMVYLEKSTTTKTKNKKEKISATTTEKIGYNPAIISALLIDDKVYKFKDLRNDYTDGNNLENCCVQKIAGNDSIAILQWADKNGVISYYTTTPRFNDYAENIEHPKYDDGGFKSFAAIKFSRCKSLGDKIYNKEEGYFYENKTASLNEKLQVWKNIIRDYIACW